MGVASRAKCFCTALARVVQVRGGRRAKVQEYKSISDADALQKFDGMVDQDGAELALSFAEDTLQGFFDVLFGVGEGDDADGGGLPDVVKIQFSDGDIELTAETGFEAAEDLALVLEGMGVGELQVEEEEAYGLLSRGH